LFNIDNKNEYFLFSQKKKVEKLTNLTQFNQPSQQLSVYQPFIKRLPWLFWFNFVLPQQLREYKIDLFFSLNHFLPIKKTTRKEVVVIHDLAWKVNPDWKNFSYRVYAKLFQQRSLQRVDKIIAVSHSTKRDIMRFYNVPESKIEVIYEGADKRFKPRELNQVSKLRLLSKLSELSNFKDFKNLPAIVLYVGRLEERKNIKGILEITKRLDSLNSKSFIRDLKFVLVGGTSKPRGEEYLKEIHKRSNILYLGDVNDEYLPFIYNLAKIFLFPSFCEGFGLTVLEAMQSGLPVLTSNTSSLLEVVGDGGLMHEPNNCEAFARDIVKLLEDKKFYQEMREKGIKQAKKFSWEKTVRKIVNIFNQL